MIRQLVQSSSLRVVGYDNDTKVLEIGFVKGGVYRYFEVPELVYLKLIGADSKGAYFHEHIRGNYRYEHTG
jgi:hypothetical protein